MISHPSSFVISCFLSQCTPLSTHPYIHIIVVCEFERTPTKLKGNPGRRLRDTQGASGALRLFWVARSLFLNSAYLMLKLFFSLLPLFSAAALVAITTCCTGVQEGEFVLDSFCCCCCDQMLQTKELKEERVHFGSQFQETVHHESQCEELEATDHITSPAKGQSNVCLLLLGSSLHTVQDPSRTGTSSSGRVSPLGSHSQDNPP